MKLLILSIVLLAGCSAIPQGVEMSEAEAKACAAEGCTVWTREELQGLARQFFQRGYQAGRKSL